MASPKYYENVDDRFRTIVVADNQVIGAAMREVGSQTPKTTVATLFEGTDDTTVRAGGEAYVVFTNEFNAANPDMPRRSPHEERGKAERALRNGGALLTLVVEGYGRTTLPFYTALERMFPGEKLV